MMKPSTLFRSTRTGSYCRQHLEPFQRNSSFLGFARKQRIVRVLDISGRVRTFSSLPIQTPLHYEWSHNGKFFKSDDPTIPPPPLLQRDGAPVSGMVLFLHGLLGNSKNLKTMIRNITKQNPQVLGIAMDLRGHGNSPMDGMSAGANSFQACAADVTQTLATINSKLTDPHLLPPLTSVVGHSWGGRIALQVSHEMLMASSSASTRKIPKTWLLDTVPGLAHSSVDSVLAAIDIVPTSGTTDKNAVLEILTKQGGLDVAMAHWLVASMKKRTDSSSLLWGFNVDVVKDLLPEFATQDFHGMLRRLAVHGRVDLIRSGQNVAWSQDTLTNLHGLAVNTTSVSSGTRSVTKQKVGFHMHELPNAGHWVHVDDLPGLLDIFQREGLE